MPRKTLALLAGLGFALAGGAAMADGDCGSYHVKSTTKQTVASADRNGTPVVIPAPNGG